MAGADPCRLEGTCLDALMWYHLEGRQKRLSVKLYTLFDEPNALK